MIVFDLDCASCGGRFESWFASGEEHDRLAGLDLLACAVCGSAEVHKAPMAPSVPRKEGSTSLAALQSELVSQSRWVGPEFAATARAIHSGEQAAERIHGQATLGEARGLIEEGVPVLPLPLPVVPPNQVN